MKNIYIAINGDDVGSRIGDAIANDDHEALAQASSSIQNAHDTVDQWIESIGGKKISSAGDDAIYLAPEQAVNDLDSVREQYKQESGHGLTVGVGASMSQASKALIYGKMNGKNQTIHYEPAIEDYLSDDETDDSQDIDQAPDVPAEGDVQDQANEDIETDAGAANLQNAPAQEEVDDSQSAVPNAAPVEEGLEEEPQVGNEDDISDDNQTQTDAPAEPVANKTPAQKDAPAGNTPEIDGKTDIDSGTSEEDLDEDQDVAAAAPTKGVDENLPDTEEQAAGAPDENVDPNAEPMEGEESDEDVAQTDEEEGSEPAELSSEDVAAPQEGAEDDQTQDDGEDPLASMIHGDMQGGDDSDLEENPDADSSIDDELRQDIAEALVSFKANKHHLEAARETNPELYDATLTMLRSMIAMAKKLGFGPEQDMADKEAEQQLEQEFPAADEGGEMPDEGEEQPADEETDDNDSESEEMPSEKKPAKGAAPAEKK